MAVEWLRSCYSSEWQLFRNSDNRTAGRYYFADEATPFYPRFHNLGSRTWNDANWPHDVSLGETVDTKTKWYSGDAPAVPALARAVGSADCIRRGEEIDDGVIAEDLVDGFVPACMRDEAWARVSSYTQCTTRRMWASLIMQLYVKDDDSIRETVADWLGDLLDPDEYTVVIHHHAGVMPGIVAIVTPGWTAFCLDGTINFQELALQAFYFAMPPANFGIIATSPLYYQAASYVLDRLEAGGMVAQTNVMCVGHSYGGASALCAAARMRHGDADREIKYLTFGSPKIGNESFRRLLKKCRGWAMANDDDLVTLLPPDAREFLPILPLIAWPLMTNWGFWKRPPGEVYMNKNGELFARSAPFLDVQTLLSMAEAAFDKQTIAPIEGHRIPEYLRRHERICPEPNWPVDLPTNRQIWLPEAVITLTGKPKPSRNGALVFTTFQPEPDPDGCSCLDAIPLVLGVTKTSPGLALCATTWYRGQVLAGVQYHVRVTPVIASTLNWALYVGQTCADAPNIFWAIDFGNDSSEFCRSFTPAADGYFWIACNVGSLRVWSFKYDVGPC